MEWALAGFVAIFVVTLFIVALGGGLWLILNEMENDDKSMFWVVMLYIIFIVLAC